MFARIKAFFSRTYLNTKTFLIQMWVAFLVIMNGMKSDMTTPGGARVMWTFVGVYAAFSFVMMVIAHGFLAAILLALYIAGTVALMLVLLIAITVFMINRDSWKASARYKDAAAAATAA